MILSFTWLNLKILSFVSVSADCAIKLLQSHGVAIIEPDKDTVVSSAVLNGHMIRLTGKK